jgi:putative spermidine/putrescine transport system substrate-binding protein
MLDRRHFMGVVAGAPFAFAIGAAAAQERKTLQVYIAGDTNIQNWWNDVIRPAFEAAHPDLTFKVTVTRGVGDENGAIAARALAALQTKTDPQVDYFEEFDPSSLKGSIEAGLWVGFDDKNVPNLAMVNKAAPQGPYRLPYRGSQVLIAYDSAKIPDAEVPKTFADIMAWTKKNPGRFAYGRPDKGGSGRNFVVRAIHEANGRDPSMFTPDNFKPELAEERFAPAWALLRDLHPNTYGGGDYPAGNSPTLQLLAQGAVDMISAWSDMALQAKKQGVFPESVKLVQLQDLALCGGFAYSAVPTNATNLDGAMKLANFMLTKEMQISCVREIGGFPGVDWSHLPPELKAEYIDVIPVSIPTFPSGDWNKAMNAGWYKNVATNITP